VVLNNISPDFVDAIYGGPSSNEDFHWTRSDSCACLQTHLDKTWLHQTIKCGLDSLDYYWSFPSLLHKSAFFCQGHLRLAHGEGASCRVCVCSFVMFKQPTND
jgi:hypothetical protein